MISADFSPDGRSLVTVGVSNASVWDTATGHLLIPLLKPVGRYARYIELAGARFNSRGDCVGVFFGTTPPTAWIWSVSTGKLVAGPLRHEQVMNSLEFSPDGEKVVTASHDGTARLWAASTGQALTQPLKHNAAVKFAQFSPDGRRVVTASSDRAARVWDASTGMPLTEPLEHEAGVEFAQFSPDGQRLLTVSGDTVRVWDVAVAVLPAAGWLPDLAEAVGRKRFNHQELLEIVPATNLLKLRRQLGVQADQTTCSKWAKWFLADRSTRTVSPLSSITVPEYVQRRIQDDTLESLQEAVSLSPTNGLAFARLARLTLATKTNAVAEADFLSRYALKWSPTDAEVKKIREEIAARIQATKTP